MDVNQVPLLLRREIEASVLGQVYQSLRRRMGQEEALSVMTQIVEQTAEEAGRAFAAASKSGPSLEHFCTIWDRLMAVPGSLETEGYELEESRMRLKVTGCGYLKLYQGMGLPQELLPVLSCCRDFAFARGYSPRLHLERPTFIGQGDEACRFEYTWQ
ncbi:MAG: L-2-amino-thiazoline-4-carboxylic acid hydrolase [Proteobacteria bacterium]|nr:L-2-amino-thiazoline-4-carboxylic acid hydrolase [Pseudomonadota bacterium]